MTNSTHIRDRLLSMGVNGSDPRWSSHVLDELFSGSGLVEEVFRSVFQLINTAELTSEVCNFVKDLSVCAFMKHRESYESSNLEWLCGNVAGDCSVSQAYFALYTIPPESLTADCVVSLLKKLEASTVWSEAISNLEEEAEKPEVKALLNDWLESGVSESCRGDIKRLVAS